MYKVARFIIAGSTAAAANLLILFLLVHFLQWHYLTASILSFLCSIGVGFTMQKFLTFRDHALAEVHVQLARYVAIALVNLVINTTLMYLFVGVLGIWYLLAQIIAAGLIAIGSYLSYQAFVFVPHETTT